MDLSITQPIHKRPKKVTISYVENYISTMPSSFAEIQQPCKKQVTRNTLIDIPVIDMLNNSATMFPNYTNHSYIYRTCI